MTENSKTPRLFRLRNGITVVENPQPYTVQDTEGGFIDDYIGATPEDIKKLEEEGYCGGSFVLLLSHNGNFPKGDLHGPDFDIVKELTSAKKEK